MRGNRLKFGPSQKGFVGKYCLKISSPHLSICSKFGSKSSDHIRHHNTVGAHLLCLLLIQRYTYKANVEVEVPCAGVGVTEEVPQFGLGTKYII